MIFPWRITLKKTTPKPVWHKHCRIIREQLGDGTVQYRPQKKVGSYDGSSWCDICEEKGARTALRPTLLAAQKVCHGHYNSKIVSQRLVKD